MVQVPVKTSQLTYSSTQYETVQWIDGHAETHEQANLDKYVLTQWGDSRFCNYFVNGDSESFTFARLEFADLVLSTDGDKKYRQLNDRVGYIVLTDDVVTNQSAIGTRLYAGNGSRTGSQPGLAHYRLLYVSEDRSHKVFGLVPGARIQGTGQNNQTLRITTEVSVPSVTITYERVVKTGPTGNYSFVVSYPGTYQVGNRTVTVSESAVRNGTTVGLN